MGFLIALTCIVILIMCWPIVLIIAGIALTLALIAGAIWAAFTWPALLLLIPGAVLWQAVKDHENARIWREARERQALTTKEPAE